MENIKILEALLKGEHLSQTELERAESLVYGLQKSIESRKPYKINFTRVNRDVNGNPRVVCHYTEISDDYSRAVKLANRIGGRKFHNKQYGGGVVFQSYNNDDLQKRILELKEN